MTPTPSPTAPVQPTPSPTATPEPRPTATPASTIAYDCPFVTLDEMTAIVGRQISYARRNQDGGCTWSFEPDAAGHASSVKLYVSPWDAAVFNSNYPNSAPEDQFPDVGDGAYWDFRDFLVFLVRNHVCDVEVSGLGESKADKVQLSIDIAQAAIPRMFTD